MLRAGDPSNADAKQYQFKDWCNEKGELKVVEGRTRALYVRNKTSFPIWVAFRVKSRGEWGVGNYRRVEPGERSGPVWFYDYRWIYYYAAGRNHKPKWSGKDFYHTLCGKRVGFRKKDTGTGNADYTLNLTDNK